MVPEQVALPFQSAHTIETTGAHAVPSLAPGAGGLTLAALRSWVAKHPKVSESGVDFDILKYLGNRNAKPSAAGMSKAATATVYVTGHGDGGVRLWDMRGDSPALLAFMPSAAAKKGRGGKARALAPATATTLCWEHGIVVAGHKKGAFVLDSALSH
jgi:hypothetical protein